jgi:hypothetical protein
MTKTARQIVTQLPAPARKALEGMPGSRIGQVVPLAANDPRRGQLAFEGVIGAGDGLTIKGSAVAMIAQAEYLDRMFG